MKYLFILASTLFVVSYLYGQNRQLSGFLIDANTKRPISGADIFLPNIGSATTTSKGQFVINITDCRNCGLGTRVDINIYHPEYGHDLQDYTFEQSYVIPTLYIDKTNSVQVLGRVFSSGDNRLLGRIKVTCQLNIPDFREPEIQTDDFGKFKFIFNQQLVGRVNFITLSFRDIDGCYMDKVITKPINQLLDIDVFMEKGNTTYCCIPINQNRISLKAKNIIQCDASMGYGSTINSAAIVDCARKGSLIEIKGNFQAKLLFNYGGRFDALYDEKEDKIVRLIAWNQFQGDRDLSQCLSSQ